MFEESLCESCPVHFEEAYEVMGEMFFFEEGESVCGELLFECFFGDKFLMSVGVCSYGKRNVEKVENGVDGVVGERES